MIRSKKYDFRKCRRCQGRDTYEIGFGNEMWAYIYVGYCNDCKDEYSYHERVENIHDKEKRI